MKTRVLWMAAACLGLIFTAGCKDGSLSTTPDFSVTPSNYTAPALTLVQDNDNVLAGPRTYTAYAKSESGETVYPQFGLQAPTAITLSSLKVDCQFTNADIKLEKSMIQQVSGSGVPDPSKPTTGAMGVYQLTLRVSFNPDTLASVEEACDVRYIAPGSPPTVAGVVVETFTLSWPSGTANAPVATPSNFGTDNHFAIDANGVLRVEVEKAPLPVPELKIETANHQIPEYDLKCSENHFKLKNTETPKLTALDYPVYRLDVIYDMTNVDLNKDISAKESCALTLHSATGTQVNTYTYPIDGIYLIVPQLVFPTGLVPPKTN